MPRFQLLNSSVSHHPLTLDRRSLLLIACFPSLAFGLLNQFWTEPAYRAGIAWFFLADATQWVIVPLLVWVLLLRPANIGVADLGLGFSAYRRRPLP